MKILISMRGDILTADPIERSGSPKMGLGKTIEECLGSFLITYQKELGLDIEVDDSAKLYEEKRRADALAQR